MLVLLIIFMVTAPHDHAQHGRSAQRGQGGNKQPDKVVQVVIQQRRSSWSWSAMAKTPTGPLCRQCGVANSVRNARLVGEQANASCCHQRRPPPSNTKPWSRSWTSCRSAGIAARWAVGEVEQLNPLRGTGIEQQASFLTWSSHRQNTEPPGQRHVLALVARVWPAYRADLWLLGLATACENRAPNGASRSRTVVCRASWQAAPKLQEVAPPPHPCPRNTAKATRIGQAQSPPVRPCRTTAPPSARSRGGAARRSNCDCKNRRSNWTSSKASRKRGNSKS